MKKEKKEPYYTLDNMIKKCPDAKYYVAYGERSNGKTFAGKYLALFGYHKNGININGYLDDGSQYAYLRRYDEDFRGKRAQTLFDDIIHNPERGNILEKESKGRWNSISYWRDGWYLEKVNENGEVMEKDIQPFGYRFSITSMVHDKSTSYPNIRLIHYDEFITQGYYLPDEFVSFMNVISTIVRKRNDVRIFMTGNTVNKYCPYFADMGLKHVKTQKKGTIDVYTYPNPNLKVAVEYSDFPAKKKDSDVYFAFDNPKLKMITTGDWEINLYPHLPYRYYPNDVIFQYFIEFDNELLHAEIVYVEPNEKNELIYPVTFTYIHRKTTELKDNGKVLIYQQYEDPRPNHSRQLLRPRNEIEKKVAKYFKDEKVFYQDNDVGEVVRNYINWSSVN